MYRDNQQTYGADLSSVSSAEGQGFELKSLRQLKVDGYRGEDREGISMHGRVGAWRVFITRRGQARYVISFEEDAYAPFILSRSDLLDLQAALARPFFALDPLDRDFHTDFRMTLTLDLKVDDAISALGLLSQADD